MKNSQNEIKLPVVDEAMFQVVTISFETENGELSLPLPMPYVFKSSDLPNVKVKDIRVSAPKPLPGFGKGGPDSLRFEEVTTDGSEQVQEQDSGGEQAQNKSSGDGAASES